jgi:hypothetical protein
MGDGDSTFLSVIGFAIGRTVFWEPLVNYNTKKNTRQVAVAQIAAFYRVWMFLFEEKDPLPDKLRTDQGRNAPDHCDG